MQYAGNGKNSRKKKKIFYSRLGQLIQWCMEEEKSKTFGVTTGVEYMIDGVPTDASTVFQGCILFDECHRAKKFYNGANGKPSQSGKAVHALQQALPGAHVVYCSATGISQPSNMGYMSRLGLWGQGTSFSNFPEFLDAVEKGGIGMSELVAMHLRRTGTYLCRTLSFATCCFETIETGTTTSESSENTFDFQDVFDKATSLWQAMYRELLCGLNQGRFEYSSSNSIESDDDEIDDWAFLENRGVKPLVLPPGNQLTRHIITVL